jgi:hypothetical protein
MARNIPTLSCQLRENERCIVVLERPLGSVLRMGRTEREVSSMVGSLWVQSELESRFERMSELRRDEIKRAKE